jgi:hypothetical protein
MCIQRLLVPSDEHCRISGQEKKQLMVYLTSAAGKRIIFTLLSCCDCGVLDAFLALAFFSGCLPVD